MNHNHNQAPPPRIRQSAAEQSPPDARPEPNAATQRTDPNIRVNFIFPPIPDRNFDWCATLDGYEPGDPMGFGKHASDAVDDLNEQLEEI